MRIQALGDMLVLIILDNDINCGVIRVQVLEANNCDLKGSLPASWAQYLPELQNISLSGNDLTGGSSPPSICHANGFLCISRRVGALECWWTDPAALLLCRNLL
jgi:hypothetical protein